MKGEETRALRKSMGLTQEEWAYLLAVSRRAVQRWEGKCPQRSVATQLGLTTRCLMGLQRMHDEQPQEFAHLAKVVLKDFKEGKPEQALYSFAIQTLHRALSIK